MTQEKLKLDIFDREIIKALQKDASLSQRELAEIVGLSQNACWRRLSNLREKGVISGQSLRLNLSAIGLGLTVFVMVKTRHHSAEWLAKFKASVLEIENVVDFFRLAGGYDYMLKLVARDVEDFDQIYQRLIARAELDTVTSYIAMEAVANARNVPV